MSRILITGITGYIGSQLAKRLSKEHRVFGLVREPLNTTYLTEVLRNNVQLIPCDGSGQSVLDALKTSHPDVVYHLATYYTSKHDLESCQKLLQSNLALGMFLVEAMTSVGCQRLIYATTITTNRGGLGYSPLSLYAATKQAFSDLVEFYTSTGLIRAAAIALSDTYGPGDQRSKVINLVREAVLTHTPLDLTQGSQVFDAVYIDDVVRAFEGLLLTLDDGAVPHRFFQLSGSNTYTLRETIELMLQVNGLSLQANWGSRPEPEFQMRDKVSIYPPPSGWKPEIPLEEASGAIGTQKKEKHEMDNRHCRFCGSELQHTFLDLGLSPLANEYLTGRALEQGQSYYPLKVQVCDHCFLVQAASYQSPDQIFGNYKYFSSYSESWLAHCKRYVDMIVPRLGLNRDSKVLEIACNDGYLLQYFKQYQIPTKGVEPAENVAEVARQRGIDVLCTFFCEETANKIAAQDGLYDLVIGNNVLAHVPDINSFVAGLPLVLCSTGTVTFEFPHLMQLIQNCQFDTIYHEHFSYLSFGTVLRVFQKHGLKIYDIEELPTHGGSLRIYATHANNDCQPIQSTVASLLKREADFGMEKIETYADFSKEVLRIKLDTLALLTELKKNGKKIVAFGAAAKGNTFLNYCGVKRDLIDFVVDSNPHKQGLYLPGSLIPIVGPGVLKQEQPNYLLILPWNLEDEIVAATEFIREWGGKYMTCIPSVKMF